MTKIESVLVFLSPHNIKDGVDIGLGLTVIIDPMPENKEDIIQIGYDIMAAVMAYNWK